MFITDQSFKTTTIVTLVDLLTWVYRDQRAHDMSHHSLMLMDQAPLETERHALSKDGLAQLAKDRKLGAYIPTTSAAQRLVLHPDAETVHWHLAQLSQNDPYGGLLIFRHAVRGLPPDYCADIPAPQPVRSVTKGGREKAVEVTVHGGHMEQRRVFNKETKTYRIAWVEVGYPYCPLSYWPSLECVTESRRDYRLWINALTQLLSRLPPLKTWAVRTLGADPAPWGWTNDNLPHQEC